LGKRIRLTASDISLAFAERDTRLRQFPASTACIQQNTSVYTIRAHDVPQLHRAGEPAEDVVRRIHELEFSGFEWDEAKRQQTLTEREIDFAEAAEAILRPHLEQTSNRNDEIRKLAICEIGTQLVAVVYTVRGDNCRIISVRAARRYEREEYNQAFRR
jgi:uncharacterized DUF497 family protein